MFKKNINKDDIHVLCVHVCIFCSSATTKILLIVKFNGGHFQEKFSKFNSISPKILGL